MTNEELLMKALEPDSDTLAGDHLLAGPRTITITEVKVNLGSDRPLIIRFEGDDGKPWKPPKTTGGSLVKLWGADFDKWVGRAVELFRDPEIKFGADKYGGVRIKSVSHIDRMTEVSERLNNRQIKVRKIQPLKMETKPDKVASGVKELIERIQNSDDIGPIENDEAVIKQRKWLNENRPELSQQIDDAINIASSVGAE